MLAQRISKLEKKVASQVGASPLEGQSVYQPNEADLADVLRCATRRRVRAREYGDDEDSGGIL